MLNSIQITGYRSLREIQLKLERVTVVTGGNGVGKSNLYRALALLQCLCAGHFAGGLAREGGMPSVLWAGKRRRDESKRLAWNVTHTDFQFEMECGMVALGPESISFFKSDPDIKTEILRLGGKVMARRKSSVIEVRSPEGKMESFPLPFHASESMLSEVRDGIRFPALAATREILLGWRFYHHFRTDADSPLRRPMLGSWSPVLYHDGSNLAATLQTINETGREGSLLAAIESAFPGCEWRTTDQAGAFQVCMHSPGAGALRQVE